VGARRGGAPQARAPPARLRRPAAPRARRAAPRRRAGALAGALRTTFRAALIDEFQDTDDVQWEIFHTAFGGAGHRLVLIGDPKQSIYAFRGADLRAYLAARADAHTVWRLDTNWRTDRPLVDALQALVRGHPLPFAEPGIRWHAVGARHAAARLHGAGAPLAVRFLAREGALTPRGKKPLPAKGQALRHLPDWVAADVVRFLSSGATLAVRDGAAPAPVRPGDVAVLVRSHRQARAVQAALRRANVPAVIHGAESVFASPEAQELAVVLAAVLEPADARLLRAALATDLLGIPAARALAALSGIGDAPSRAGQRAARRRRRARPARGAARSARARVGRVERAAAAVGRGVARRDGRGARGGRARRARCVSCARCARSSRCPPRCSPSRTASAGSPTCCTWASCCTPRRWRARSPRAPRSPGCAPRSRAARAPATTRRASSAWRATRRPRRS
jgi:exodeoxyribonuclease V beta subunit